MFRLAARQQALFTAATTRPIYRGLGAPRNNAAVSVVVGFEVHGGVTGGLGYLKYESMWLTSSVWTYS